MDINPVIFAQVTNREDWYQLISLNDKDTGDPIDLSAVTFQLEIRPVGNRGMQSGYGTSYSFGDYANSGPILSASLGNGITIVDIGVIQVLIPETQMRTLPPDTYSVACTISDGTSTRQLFLGKLPVLNGMVTA